MTTTESTEHSELYNHPLTDAVIGCAIEVHRFNPSVLSVLSVLSVVNSKCRLSLIRLSERTYYCAGLPNSLASPRASVFRNLGLK